MSRFTKYGRILALAVAAAALPAGWAESGHVLRGRLEARAGEPLEEGKPLVFVTLDGKKYAVRGDHFSEAQLRDSRLAGRVWELEGAIDPEGRFEIRKLFTVKDGRRYVVKYYCEVCNIYTHEPGRCMCCQDETDLKELPESE